MPLARRFVRQGANGQNRNFGLKDRVLTKAIPLDRWFPLCGSFQSLLAAIWRPGAIFKKRLFYRLMAR